MPETQCGFRDGRSTLDSGHDFCSREQHRDVYIAFVDLLTDLCPPLRSTFAVRETLMLNFKWVKGVSLGGQGPPLGNSREMRMSSQVYPIDQRSARVSA